MKFSLDIADIAALIHASGQDVQDCGQANVTIEGETPLRYELLLISDGGLLFIVCPGCGQKTQSLFVNQANGGLYCPGCRESALNA